MADIGDIFNIGDKVPNSGIYDVLHDSHHQQKHQVTCVFEEPFPPCHGCGNEVQFRLAIKALHILHDPEFKAKKK